MSRNFLSVKALLLVLFLNWIFLASCFGCFMGFLYYGSIEAKMLSSLCYWGMHISALLGLGGAILVLHFSLQTKKALPKGNLYGSSTEIIEWRQQQCIALAMVSAGCSCILSILPIFFEVMFRIFFKVAY